MSLDLEAAGRQTLATSFRQEEVDRLLAGRLLMPPHPEWALPAEPTWQEDPFEDRNWTFQFHMLRWLEPLRRAAAKGHDEAFGMWLRWVQDWVEKNPPRSPRTPWAWTDMSDGIRAQQLCQAAPMIAERRPDLLPWLEETIRAHAEHLADPRKMGNANHALHQQESLFVCGRVLAEEHFWRLASERMAGLLTEQYDEQGVNAEGATAYHYNNFLWWERALERFDIEGLARPEGADRHLHAPEEIAHATRPDGTLVPIGDTDTVDPRAIEHPAIAYVTTDGHDGEAPSDTVKIYDAGLILARSGWGDEDRPFSQQTFYSARFGTSRRVHGHPDGGSITYSALGVNWVVDLGKFQYGSGVVRDHVFSRAAHSLVSIEGKKPRKEATVELTGQRLTPEFHEYVLTDDSFRGIRLTRRLVYSVAGEYLCVLDTIDSPRKVTALQRWQLDPAVSVDLAGATARLHTASAHGMLATIGADAASTVVRAQEEPFDGWVSTAWKTKAPAAAVTFRRSGTSIVLATVLATDSGREPSVTGSSTADGRLEVDVSTRGLGERMTFSPAGVHLSRNDAPSAM